MTPDERTRIDSIIATLLDAVARETGKDREWLSLEVEQVIGRGVFEAYRIGNSSEERIGRRRRSGVNLPAVTDEPEDDDG